MANKGDPQNRFKLFYPVGNSPPVDVTQGCQVARQCDVLLLGCGDIRNVLHTTHVLHESKTLCSSAQVVNYHLNDNQSAIITRDLILFHILKTIDPNDGADLKFLWSVWYDVVLSRDHFSRLTGIMNNLAQCKVGDLDVIFGNEETEEAVKTCLEAWGRSNLTGNDITEKRLAFFKNKFGDGFPEIPTKDIASRLNFQCYKLLDDERLRDRYSQEVREYLEMGSTRFGTPSTSLRTVLSSFYGNTTFFPPGSNDWMVPEDSSPFMCFDVERYLDRYDGSKTTMSRLSLNVLRQWVNNFQTAANQCTIKIHLWLEDAKTLCEKTLPEDLTFDFIDTSNLADDIGLIPLILCCQGKLKRESGVVRTESFHWHRCLESEGRAKVEQDKQLESFLRKCVDVHPLMYPTILGLHLAEELKLGHEHVLGGGSFEGCNKVELRWRIASDTLTPLTVEFEDLVYCRDSNLQTQDVIYTCLKHLKTSTELKDDPENITVATVDNTTKQKLVDRLSRITKSEAMNIGTSQEPKGTMKVREFDERYEVEIKTAAKGELTCSHEDGTSRAVTIQLVNGSKTTFNITLHFACDVSLEDSTIENSKEGVIAATFMKNQSQTVGEHILQWRKMATADVALLPDYPMTELNVNSLWLYHMWVYPREDLHRGVDVERQGGHPLHQLQDLLEILLIPDPDTNELLQKTYVPKEGVVIAGPIYQGYRFAIVADSYKLWEGKPTLFVTMFISDMAHKLIREGKISLLGMWQDLGLGGFGIENKFPEGFDLLETILLINASRMVQDLTEKGQWKIKSFLRMRYPFKIPRAYYNDVQPVTKHLKHTTDKNDEGTQICLRRALEYCRS